MDRDSLTAVLFGVGALVVLAVGGWLFFGPGPSAGRNEAEPPPPPSVDARGEAPQGPRLVDVPRCPLQVRLGPTFRRRETEHKSPNLRVVSKRRAKQVDVSCRRADQDFERSQFLDETLRAVEARYEGELEGKRRVSSGPAGGWTTWRTESGEMKLFNVLVRDSTVVTVHVFGPDARSTRKFNRELIENHLVWPGFDRSTADASSETGDTSSVEPAR